VVKGLRIAPTNRVGQCALFGIALSLALGGTVRADVVAVVSSKNPVRSMNKSQVADIFLGRILRFPDGALAVPIDQEEGSPARDEFYAAFAGKSPAQLKSHWTKIIFTGRGKPPMAASSSAEVRRLIAANPQAIGYIERSAVDSTIKVLEFPAK
jgi:ABC-type phosphate transport system substrate-binding protein